MSIQSRSQNPTVDRLYLDFDSFFASAEQHFNPALRGRPVGVLPLASAHTGCIAISREAKARGLKGGAKVSDAKKLIPDMVFVVARHDVYVRLHNRILNVIEACVPVANVRSIDEVVCHLLPCEAREGVLLANRIKRALAENFSSTLTCSIGMAPSELLAKIGAEMNKPDGFTYLDMADLPHRLTHLDLQDLPGISNGVETRLNAAGICDIQALWDTAPKQARAVWGSVEGERFWNELHGRHAQRPATVKRMFGHSRMLPFDWRGPEKIRICAQQLAISASRRLRRADLRATKLTLSFRGGKTHGQNGGRKDYTSWGQEIQFQPARDDHTILSALSGGLQTSERHMKFRPRSVSVMLHGLISDDAVMDDLFSGQDIGMNRGSVKKDRDKWESISDMMDQLRAIHGPEVISLGPQSKMPGGYLGAKIAFGRIPDQSDFGNAPVSDTDTHFYNA